MSILVCGSVAYDSIMVFHDRFKNHILPEQIHILNVSFLVPDLRREFGGCAGNIAYSLKLLGADPLIMATVGEDAGPYRYRLQKLGLRQDHVREVPGTFTAQAFITTDLDDNQITAFHPGAMFHSHLNDVREARGVKLGIVSPDGRDGMLRHARGFAAAGVPFVFDPGQALPILGSEELLECLQLATYCTVNDYEARLMSEKTGRSEAELAAMVDGFVVTLGAEGSRIRHRGEVLSIAAAKPDAIIDPTGCGDAYRAGLLYGDCKRVGHAACGPAGRGDGGAQDRPPRRTEPPADARRYCGALSAGFRRGSMVSLRTTRLQATAGALAALLILGGCAQGLGGGAYSRTEARRAMTVQFGTVESVRGVQLEGTKTPVGTVAGAAVGGIAGSTVGGGRGQAVATVIGAVAGGLAGAAVEEGVTRTQGVEVTVRLDNGQFLAVVQADEGEGFRPGERVYVLRDAGTTRVTR